MQFATDIRNGMLNGIPAALGSGLTLEIFTGAKPANLSDPDTGTKLISADLPDPAFAAAANGSISKTGTWEDPEANASGDGGYFRIKDSGGTPKIQGTVGAESSGADMELSDVSLVAGQTVAVTTFQINDPNN